MAARSPKKGGKSAGERWGDLSLERRVALVTAVIALVTALIFLLQGRGSAILVSDPSPAKLEVVRTSVRNETTLGHASLEVLLHNEGGRLAVIDGARFRIRRVYELERCTAQQNLGVSQFYQVTLPWNADPGDELEAPLHQQVGPDEADRFEISMTATVPHDRVSIFLFGLDASLLADGPTGSLPLGRVLVALPSVPTGGEYILTPKTVSVIRNWPHGDPGAAEIWRKAMPCWRSNTATLRHLLSGPGIRSPELQKLEDEMVTPSFAVIRQPG